MVGCRADCWPRGVSRMLHQRLEGGWSARRTPMCNSAGSFVVELRGCRVEQRFPSRQGRTLFAYLVLQRPRAVGRDELTEAIWGDAAPKDHAQALTVLLSKLRAAVGSDVLAGRGEVRLDLAARCTSRRRAGIGRRAPSRVRGRATGLGARLERRAVRSVRRRPAVAAGPGRPSVARRMATPARRHAREGTGDVRRRLPGARWHRAGRRRAGGTTPPRAQPTSRDRLRHADADARRTRSGAGGAPRLRASLHRPARRSWASRPDPRSRASTPACSKDERPSRAGNEAAGRFPDR